MHAALNPQDSHKSKALQPLEGANQSCCGAGMLLNLQGSYRGKTLQSPEGTNLMEALHVAGLGSHSACFGAAAVRELQAAEFPSDALWTDRIPEMDSLVAALLVRPYLLCIPLPLHAGFRGVTSHVPMVRPTASCIPGRPSAT